MNWVRQVRCYRCCWSFALFTLFVGFARADAAIVYSTPDSIYQQNFNTLTRASTAQTWTNNSTVPGWYSFLRQPNGNIGAVAQYRANSGSFTPNIMNSTSLFSYGPALLQPNETDRAFGHTTFTYLSTSIGDGIMAVAFENQTGSSMDSFTVAYDGEQWRKATNANSQSLTFSYGFGNTFGGVSSWTNLPSLDFASPVFNNNAATALNGNAAANRVAGITDTVSGFDWQAGTRLWLRWDDINTAGDNHQLAIDNFSFSATGSITAVPEPSSMMLVGIVGLSGLVYRRSRRDRQWLSSYNRQTAGSPPSGDGGYSVATFART